MTALAPGINPGINLSGTQENSGDLGELELTPEQARDRRAVDLITRRSRVRIPPPLLTKGPHTEGPWCFCAANAYFLLAVERREVLERPPEDILEAPRGTKPYRRGAVYTNLMMAPTITAARLDRQ